MKQFSTIASEQDVHEVLKYTHWSVYARLADREDWAIYNHVGVRTVDGVLQVNAGEWNPRLQQYNNDEWVIPRFVYMVHQCDGCNYPPSMCCLQASSFDRSLQDYWSPEREGEVMSSDAYTEAEDRLGQVPNVKIIPIEV